MLSELRLALRSLARDGRASLLAVCLFSLTIGVTTAVYAVVDAVIVRPIAMEAPDRTVVIWQRDDARSTPVVEVADGEVETWRRNASSIGRLGVFGSVNWTLTLLEGESVARVAYAAVSASFFDAVGTPPALGRLLHARDDIEQEPRTVVISDALWRERFAASPQVIGRTIRVQDDVEGPIRSLEVVGVMPADFDFPRGARLWLSAAPTIRALEHRNGHAAGTYLANLRVFYAIGRLAHGTTVRQAQQELRRIARPPEQVGSPGAPTDVVVTEVDDFLLGPAQPVLWTMLAGAVLMVLLACSSVAGLQLFRSARRERALAVQLALGAGRNRLIARTLGESGLLALAGTLGALGIAWASTTFLVTAAPLDVPRLNTVTLIAQPVFGLMAGLATFVGMLSGAWPAVFIGHIDAARTLTSGTRTVMHPRERRIQRVLVGWQVAVAVVLLSGAALFVRSVQHLDRTALGFQPERLLSIVVEPSVKDIEQWDRVYATLLTRIEELADVASAGAVYLRPLSGPIGNDVIPVLAGQAGLAPDAPWRRNPRANLQAVTPGFFRTLGTRVLAGRDFTFEDRAAAPNVVIVGASAAARYWPGRNPIGEPIVVPTQRAPGSREQLRWMTVVGVVEDVRYRGVTDRRLDVYLPAAQSTARVKHLMIRANAPADRVITSVRRLARELDPGVHVGEAVTMTDVVARETAPWRFAMRVLGFFGGLAALLATIGLVAVVSLVLATRRQELGVRAALGATPHRLRLHALREASRTTIAATVIGVVTAVAVGQLLESLLVGTTPSDPLAHAGAALITLAAGVFGCLLPARRAGAITPMDALRE